VEIVTAADIMVPLAEYATVSQDASLFEAVQALEKAQTRFDQNKYRHRAILVYNEQDKIVGKLSQMDVIRALEPKYKEMGDISKMSHWELSPAFIKSMMKSFDLWQTPLEDICRKAGQIKVKDIMYTPAAGEYVNRDTTLDQAIHQLIVGHHQSLLVTQEERVVGILRLTDVFHQVCKVIKECSLD
jgi:CBS domain-containing protein